MGEHEDWVHPSGLSPNGLLPNEGDPVIRSLDSERWLQAEKRTEEIISRIQPNNPSEERRKAVSDYVQRMIMKCFPCQVFMFGSVPLKTYLPDGDIDLTAFSNNQNLKDIWAYQVRDMLENEEKNETAEFHVKEVQYIQAEVKIIKCLVENIVVDISFNQLGGLCTLCFLEEVDHLIDQRHLFKRSIILIKAWCYYESRILGAHHGLISTYALETLVLYIFHLFNNCFAGPLEVLYRFLEFFSNFDWDNFCLSLWGPVPMTSLPDITAEPPRKDKGDLLLSKLFLDACSSVYAVFPAGQEIQGQSFLSKHFNVIDPLRVNNNLGRSVSKGNFFRIRSAFAFGAKRLARIVDGPEEKLVSEVNMFFTNTWDRHGTGPRPDVPSDRLDSVKNRRTSGAARPCGTSVVPRTSRFGKPDLSASDNQGRYLFARTHSSPELTESHGKTSLESGTVGGVWRKSQRSDTETHAAGMQQEEQDLINMLAVSSGASQVPFPVYGGGGHRANADPFWGMNLVAAAEDHDGDPTDDPRRKTAVYGKARTVSDHDADDDGPDSFSSSVYFDGSGRPFAFYPTGPPVPFFTMLPVYDEPPPPPQSDILSSDFPSHWHNLQYGRFCQSPLASSGYPSPSVVPPLYLQGRIPWDGPGRPNANLLNQLMVGCYGSHVVPVQSRPAGIYHYAADDMPRYRSGGTGTYLPNPKVGTRDRSGARRVDHHYYGDRDWNGNGKGRISGRVRGDKPHRSAGNSSSDKSSWVSNHRTSTTAAGHQNGAVTYGLHPLQVMVYPFDHGSGRYPAPVSDGSEFGLPGRTTSQPSPEQPSSPHVQSGGI